MYQSELSSIFYCVSVWFINQGVSNLRVGQTLLLRLKPCPFGSGLRKFALDPVFVIFFKNEKKYKWWSDRIYNLIMAMGFSAMFTFQQDTLLAPHCRIGSCRYVRALSDHHLYFFSFLKKITKTGSNANFLSPEPN